MKNLNVIYSHFFYYDVFQIINLCCYLSKEKYFFCRKMANSEKGMTFGEVLTSEKKLLKKIERQKGRTLKYIYREVICIVLEAPNCSGVYTKMD